MTILICIICLFILQVDDNITPEYMTKKIAEEHTQSAKASTSKKSNNARKKHDGNGDVPESLKCFMEEIRNEMKEIRKEMVLLPELCAQVLRIMRNCEL